MARRPLLLVGRPVEEAVRRRDEALGRYAGVTPREEVVADDVFLSGMIDIVAPQFLFPLTDEEKEMQYEQAEATKKMRAKARNAKKGGGKEQPVIVKNKPSKSERAASKITGHKSNTEIIAEREGLPLSVWAKGDGNNGGGAETSEVVEEMARGKKRSASETEGDVDEAASSSKKAKTDDTPVQEKLRQRLAQKLETLRKSRVSKDPAHEEAKRNEKKRTREEKSDKSSRKSRKTVKDPSPTKRNPPSTAEKQKPQASPQDSAKKLQIKLSNMTFNRFEYEDEDKKKAATLLPENGKDLNGHGKDGHTSKKVNLRNVIQLAEAKQKKLEDLKARGETDVVEDAKWESIEKHASGERTLIDNAKKLKKKLKLKEKKKKKSTEEWAKRLHAVKSAGEAKIASREQNIAKRKEKIVEKRLKNKGIIVPSSSDATTSKPPGSGETKDGKRKHHGSNSSSNNNKPRNSPGGANKTSQKPNGGKPQRRKGFEGRHSGFLNESA